MSIIKTFSARWSTFRKEITVPRIAATLLLLASITIALVVRFSHIEMTETQLLINFPIEWVLVVGLAIISGWLYSL